MQKSFLLIVIFNFALSIGFDFIFTVTAASDVIFDGIDSQ